MSINLKLSEAEYEEILKMRMENEMEKDTDLPNRSVAIKKSDGSNFSKDDISKIISWIYENINYSIESLVKLTKNNMLFVNFVVNSQPVEKFLKIMNFTIDDTTYVVSTSKSRPIPDDIMESITSSDKKASPIVYLGFGPVPVTESTIVKVFLKHNAIPYKITIKERFGNYSAFIQTNSIRTAMTINQIESLGDDFCIHKSHFRIGYGKEPIKPKAAGAKPKAVGAKPMAAGAKPMAAGAKPMAAGAKPMAAGAKPMAAGAKSSGILPNHNTIYIGCSTTPITDEQVMNALSKYEIPICNITIRKVPLRETLTLHEVFVITNSITHIEKAIKNSVQIRTDLGVNPKYFRIGSKKST